MALGALLTAGSLLYGAYQSNKQGKNQEKAQGTADALAQEEAGMRREVFEGSRPSRIAAESRLHERVKPGPAGVPDLSGLRDTINPFARHFTPPSINTAPAMPAPPSSGQFVGAPGSTPTGRMDPYAAGGLRDLPGPAISAPPQEQLLKGFNMDAWRQMQEHEKQKAADAALMRELDANGDQTYRPRITPPSPAGSRF